MEYTIDRTSYRRSNRINYVEQVKPKKNHAIKIVFLNEIIISMSILIGVLGIKLLDLKYAEEWISKKINTGISYEELSSKISSKYTSIYNNFKSLYNEEQSHQYRHIRGRHSGLRAGYRLLVRLFRCGQERQLHPGAGSEGADPGDGGRL